MDPISNLISSRADALFKTPTPILNFPNIDININDDNADPIIDLEAKIDPQIDEDILFQEEVPFSPPIAPKIPKIPSTEKIDKLKIMMHSLRDQLDAMLKFLDGD